MKVQMRNGTEWWHMETHSNICKISEIIPLKNGFSNSYHALNHFYLVSVQFLAIPNMLLWHHQIMMKCRWFDIFEAN